MSSAPWVDADSAPHDDVARHRRGIRFLIRDQRTPMISSLAALEVTLPHGVVIVHVYAPASAAPRLISINLEV